MLTAGCAALELEAPTPGLLRYTENRIAGEDGDAAQPRHALRALRGPERTAVWAMVFPVYDSQGIARDRGLRHRPRLAPDRVMRVTALLFTAFLLCIPPGAGAAEPLCRQKSVRLLVGFPPGGTTDILARLLAHGLSGYFRQQFVVDNRPGATGNIAADAAAKARTDGCTYLVVSAAFASNVYVSVNAGHDPLQDFTPVTRIAAVHNVLVVHPSLPVTDVASFVVFAKARPGETVMGTAGSGSTSHLAVELLKARVGGLQLVQVPYKGLGPAVIDLISGEIAGMFATTPPVAPHIKSRRLRALAVANVRRAAALPDVPTFEESGFPDFEAAAWNGIVAPVGTPYDTVTRLNVAVVELLKSPELRERLAAQGADPIGDTPDDFRAYLRTEVDKWARVAKQSGPRIE